MTNTPMNENGPAFGRLLRNCLFAGIPSGEVSDILGHIGGAVRRYSKDDIIIHAGSEVKWLLAILSGNVIVGEQQADGKLNLVRVIGANECFGASCLTTHNAHYPCMLTAAGECAVAFLEVSKIRELWHEMRHRKLFENILAIVSGYVLDCRQKLSLLSCKTSETKFQRYLELVSAETGSDDLQLPFARMEDCATYLGVTRAALSPAIARLVAKGRVEHLGHGHFKLLRPPRT